MAYTLEISYFNSIVLKPETGIVQLPLDANGSFIATETLSGDAKAGDYHIEESRIKGGFNEDSMGFGVKAYITDENYDINHRSNAMIFSGVFNTKTGVNNTNQFNSSQPITRAVDIADGSIQKLYSEDTNLIIFQEDKVNRALIDKDAIFTAEGQALTVSGAKVIGQIIPYSGRFGISKNPESFAVYGRRKYFVDKSRSAVLRLSQDGITTISEYGMSDYFKDNIKKYGVIYGAFDEHNKKYTVSLQEGTDQDDDATLSFDDRINGWVSFYSYIPNFSFSLNTKYYTFNNIDIYEHYANELRNVFYGRPFVSTIDLVSNQSPSLVKNFHTINYEGTTGWKMNTSVTDSGDAAYTVLANDTSVSASTIPVNFVRKENKYYGHLRNNTPTNYSGQVVGIDVSGIKGFFTKVQLENNKTTQAELFSVSHNAVFSSS